SMTIDSALAPARSLAAGRNPPPVLRVGDSTQLTRLTHLTLRPWLGRFAGLLGSFLFLLCSLPKTGAADWPQFRGPNHDSTTPERILTAWPQEGPRRLWKAPLPGGFSSITVSDGKAFTMVKRMIEGAEREVCVALNTTNGKEIWS